MPFGGLQVVMIILTAWLTNRFKLRYPVIAYVIHIAVVDSTVYLTVVI